MKEIINSCIDDLIKKFQIEEIYIYGSYVNGYYKKDSDIDLVALTNTSARKRPLDIPPNISVHLIHPLTMRFFETGIAYAHLRMVPLNNEEKCREISDKLKSELVRRELIRFKKKGISDFGVLDPLYNYLLGYGIERPWRIKPIKRLLKSEESKKILTGEYQRIFNLLEEKEMLKKDNGKYKINEDFVFDYETGPAKISNSLEFKIKNSCGGWYYLTRFPEMMSFVSKRV